MMKKWIHTYQEMTSHTKSFWLQVFLYGIVIVISTIYVYVRLDHVRSYVIPQNQEERQEQNKT